MKKADSTIESALAEIRAQLQALAERVAKIEQSAAVQARDGGASPKLLRSRTRANLSRNTISWRLRLRSRRDLESACACARSD